MKQGTVLGGSLCGSSTAELCKEIKHGGAPILNEIIKTVLFVDDSTTANIGFNDTIKSHQKVVLFSNRKRWELNETKCFQLIINEKNSIPPPILYINGHELERVMSTKLLGDILSSNGSNNSMIEERTKKARTATISIMSLCSDVTLGYHRVKVLIMLYIAIFIAAVLFNSQVWSNITITQENKLQTVQLKFLKRTLHAPNSTSNAFTFLEFGVLPIKYEIHKRKLMFYHHIFTLPTTDPVFKVHTQQQKLPFEKNWTNEVYKLLEVYSLDVIDITAISKKEWKKVVEENIKAEAFQALSKECRSKTKTYSLKHETFTPQKYLTSLSFELSSLLFKIRSKNLKCRNNHHSSSQSLICRLCDVSIETQEHIVNCTLVRGDNPPIAFEQFYQPHIEPECIDIFDLIEVRDRYKLFLKLTNSNNMAGGDDSIGNLVHT